MCRSSDECPRGQTCSSGVCTSTAASSWTIRAAVAVGLGVAMLLASCDLTAAQLHDLQTWQRAAAQACSVPGQCPVQRACIVAVIGATDGDAKNPRKLYSAAASGPCSPYVAKAVP